MNKIKTIVLVALLAAFSSTAYAQLESSIFFNMLMPVGTFAKGATMTHLVDPGTLEEGNVMGLNEIGKDAVFGIGGTYRIGYVFDINVGLIQPFLEGTLSWNRVSSDSRDKYEKYDGRVPNYFNIPVMVGIKYSYPLNETLQPYGEFGVGYDLLLVGSEGKKGSALTDLRYTAGSALGWQLGAGVIIGKYFSAGISYLNYGRHKIRYSSKSEASTLTQNALATSEGTVNKYVYRTLGTFAIRLGFHF